MDAKVTTWLFCLLIVCLGGCQNQKEKNKTVFTPDYMNLNFYFSNDSYSPMVLRFMSGKGLNIDGAMRYSPMSYEYSMKAIPYHEQSNIAQELTTPFNFFEDSLEKYNLQKFILDINYDILYPRTEVIIYKKRVRAIYISGLLTEDKYLGELTKFKYLTHLSLENVQVDSMADFSASKLKSFTLTFFSTCGDTFDFNKLPFDIEYIDLSTCQIEHFLNCKNLKKLKFISIIGNRTYKTSCYQNTNLICHGCPPNSVLWQDVKQARKNNEFNKIIIPDRPPFWWF